MELDAFLAELNACRTITGESPLPDVVHRARQDALCITGELSSAYGAGFRTRAA